MKHGYPIWENGEIIIWTEYETLFKGRIFTEQPKNVERSRTDCIEDGISNEQEDEKP